MPYLNHPTGVQVLYVYHYHTACISFTLFCWCDHRQWYTKLRWSIQVYACSKQRHYTRE